MRVFVALEVPDRDVLDSLVSFQRELVATGADLKPVEKENLHFTVKFLGEISEAQAREAGERLKKLRLARATVDLQGVGAFPNASRPGVVWAGVPRSHEPRVVPIAEEAINALHGIGEEDNRPFTPHVTLARVRSERRRPELVALLRSNAERRFGEVTLTEMRLKSSVLGPRGPTYTDVGVYPLT